MRFIKFTLPRDKSDEFSQKFLYNHGIETNFNKSTGIANPEEDTLDMCLQHQHHQGETLS